MSFIEASIFILLLASVSVPIANRFKIPLELFLVIGSCIISQIPGLPPIQLNPIVVFQIFLPPILFYAAYFTSWQDFKYNIRPIMHLAFGLTLFTAVVVALAATYFIPGFTWLEGLLLGAIVSPTDASSAITISKNIGAPRRLITLLSGESLLNDAAALTLFRFCIAAILVGSFSTGLAITQFFIVTLGGAAIGLAIGYAAVYLLQLIKDMQAEITLTFIVAFSCYFVAEHFKVSGVIATVVCGIYFGRRIPEYVSSTTRFNAKSNWNTLMFIINGFIFTIIGLELPVILKNIGPYSTTSLILYGSLISLVVILARLVWVFPAAYLPRRLFPGIAKKDPMPPWRMLIIVGWSGMRGIISLAAALSIPLQLSPNIAFPQRDLILFLTYCVIVATLILPTITLPFLLRYFKLPDDSEELIKEEIVIRIRALDAAIDHLSEIARKGHISQDIIKQFHDDILQRKETLSSALYETPYSTLSKEYFTTKKLALGLVKAERRALLEMRKKGELHDEIFHKLLDEIDLEEVRIRSVRF